MGSIRLRLNASEIAALMKQAKGQGGYQSLAIALQGRLDPNTGQITLDDSEVGAIVRAIGYTSGGFQGRFSRAFGRSLRERLSKN
jgi:hypothetical protein